MKRLLVSPARAIFRLIARSPLGRRLLARSALELEGALTAVARDPQPEPAPEPPQPAEDPVLISARNRAKWDSAEEAPPYLTSGMPSLGTLNRLCALEDWQHPALRAAMRRMLPYYVEAHPQYPDHLEHRKHWEFAFCVVGLELCGALGRDARVLAVGAGHEEPLYDLTTRVGELYATDVYGSGTFSLLEADARMLIDPDQFAVCPYDRRRLRVEYMSALDLRWPDGTFDVVYSLSSIEHFGGLDGARRGLEEMARVLKPGGTAVLTTECIVNGATHWSGHELDLFTPDEVRQLLQSCPGLSLTGDLDLELTELTGRAPVRELAAVIEDAQQRGHIEYPQVLLELDGRVYTSVAAFLRRDA